MANIVVRMAPCACCRVREREREKVSPLNFIQLFKIDHEAHLQLAPGVEFLQTVDSLLSMYNGRNTFTLLFWD